MLTRGIAGAYRDGVARVAASNAVRTVLSGNAEGREAMPALFATDGETFASNLELGEEVFGPMGIIVTARSDDEMVAIATRMHGQLTATLQMDPDDADLARRLMPVLERKAGRLLANGFPTGVEGGRRHDAWRTVPRPAPAQPPPRSARWRSGASCAPSRSRVFCRRGCWTTTCWPEARAYAGLRRPSGQKNAAACQVAASGQRYRRSIRAPRSTAAPC